MFESILIRPNSSREHSLDFGQLIENLFFYNKTIAHIGRHEIRGLFDLAEVDVLERLLQLEELSVYYNNSHTAIIKQGEIHAVDSVGLANLDLEKELYEESFRYKKDRLRSRKFSKKLSRLIHTYELPADFHKILNEQLNDDDFRNQVLNETIREYQPDFKGEFKELRYELEFVNDTNFKIHTNFDTLGIDVNRIKDDSPILSLINACEDLQVMSEFSAEVSLPEFNSKIIRLKVDSAIEKGVKAKREIEVFSHFAFDKSWALREAVNKKKVHLKAVLQILQKGSKYKEWLQGLPDDSNLMFAYVQKVQEGNILESMPAKAIRFYFFNGLTAILGAINSEVGIPLGLAVSAFDTFLLEKLGKNWKPSQFIEGELRPLLNFDDKK